MTACEYQIVGENLYLFPHPIDLPRERRVTTVYVKARLPLVVPGVESSVYDEPFTIYRCVHHTIKIPLLGFIHIIPPPYKYDIAPIPDAGFSPAKVLSSGIDLLNDFWPDQIVETILTYACPGLDCDLASQVTSDGMTFMRDNHDVKYLRGTTGFMVAKQYFEWYRTSHPSCEFGNWFYLPMITDAITDYNHNALKMISIHSTGIAIKGVIYSLAYRAQPFAICRVEGSGRARLIIQPIHNEKYVPGALKSLSVGTDDVFGFPLRLDGEVVEKASSRTGRGAHGLIVETKLPALIEYTWAGCKLGDAILINVEQ
jgi:hypothetical protein